jgi:ubiquinone biosynthesis O-methyltransferase
MIHYQKTLRNCRYHLPFGITRRSNPTTTITYTTATRTTTQLGDETHLPSSCSQPLLLLSFQPPYAYNNNYRRHNSSTSNTSSTHHRTEIEKFSNMSRAWWDPRQNPLLSMNPVRIQFILQCIQQFLVHTHTTTTPPTPVSVPATNNPNNNHSHPPTVEVSNPDVVPPIPLSSPKLLPLHGLRILDIGCGGGLLSESLIRLGAAAVVGMDPSISLIQMAQHHAQQTLSKSLFNHNNLQYLSNITVEEYAQRYTTTTTTLTTTTNPPNQPLSSSSSSSSSSRPSPLPVHPPPFDIICCCDVIEHVEDPVSLLTAACSSPTLLRPGGLLFVSTINRTCSSYVLTILGAEYIAGLVPRGTHEYARYLSPTTLQQYLSLSSLHGGGTEMIPRSISGMVVPYTSLPATMLWNQWSWRLDPNDTNVNWIGCYQKGIMR